MAQDRLKTWEILFQRALGLIDSLGRAGASLEDSTFGGGTVLMLRLGGEKRFESIDETHFDRLARRMEAPSKFVLETVKETVATARKGWPAIIREVGFPENMRDRLYGYWAGLSELLRLRQ